MVKLLFLLIAVIAAVIVALFLWNKPVLLIYFQIVYCCTFRFFKCYLGLPEAIKYVMDIINIWLIVLTILKLRGKKNVWNIRNISITVLVFIIGSVISFIYNNQSIILYLWSLRTTLRLMSFFVACIVFLSKEDIERMAKIFYVLLGGNVVMSAFQYFVQGFTFDFNGGLFGFEQGCNGYMNIFLTMITIYAVAMFMYKKASVASIVYVVVCSMTIAVLSELKIYFFELAIILFLVIITQKPSWRTVISIVFAVLCLVIGINVLFVLYPYWKDFFNYETIMEYLTMDYSVGSYTLNRLSGIPYIYDNIFTSWVQDIFGTGCGSGDYTFGIMGDIYREYSSLHYEWFTNVHITLECGMFGLVSYHAFFVVGMMDSFKRMFNDVANKEIHTMTFIAMIMAIITMWYNLVLRLEINYVLAFWLAVSYIYAKTPRHKYIVKINEE